MARYHFTTDSFDAWDQSQPTFHSMPARNKRLQETFQLLSIQLTTFALSAMGIVLSGTVSLPLTILAAVSSFILVVLVHLKEKSNEQILGMPASFFYLMLLSMAMGIGAGPLLLMYASITNGPMLIALAAVITAATTWGLTAYASVTDKEFSYLKAFLFMMLMGLLVTNLVNIFLGSVMLDFVSTAISIGVFSLYLLVDVKDIQEGNRASRYSAALILFLDIVNLFEDVLRMLGYVSYENKDGKSHGFSSDTLFKLFSVFLVLGAVLGLSTRESTPNQTARREQGFFGGAAESDNEAEDDLVEGAVPQFV